MTRTAVPTLFVLFGGTGDLAKRKLFPGLYRLYRRGLVPGEFRVIGTGRTSPGGDEAYRALLEEWVRKFAGDDFDDAAWARFAARITFTASSAQDGWALAARVRAAQAQLGPGAETVLYLSVPPTTMEPVVSMLGRTGLAAGARLVLEKPFGSDLASARSLNAALHGVFDEDRLFRIDHFLGKEAVQNILAFRFANGMFEPLWNRDRIAYVQIDVPEVIGIEGRAAFMESTGTFRDMVCTHLFQMLGFLALEPPASLTADALREEKRKVFAAVRDIAPRDVVFGQYDGYRAEDGVDPASTVETFAAVRVWVDNWRWQGVPFLLRTGKAMAESRRTITLGLHEPPTRLFPSAEGTPNELVFDLSDDARVRVEFRVKRPGPRLEVGHAQLSLDVSEAFPGEQALEAYERLLLDVLNDDRTLFTSADEVERLWELSDPVLEGAPKVLPYPRGSWGPDAVRELAGERGWRLPE
ncbi:glucose-6-phosphate dehydrogenase [Actinokineospora bangkokensis]|uniref:Glucose-6-phosphate 1-dehydrogenase n=1 Tax=Actinokineospora bangkokensis TaxID=1193682 RepID=A0A1Q9LKV0_9PSEU|nr:glucose-6-phosphate dehydrogenase [Actinokineospora bangkokensis]OLR92662.1 glucose-6-phosphate dehydrogenase [Actinokineospora bangkokensis]